jgi:hypothetical protein
VARRAPSEDAVIRDLARAGVRELDVYDGLGFRGLVLVASGGTPVAIDNVWADSSSPVADALDEAVCLARSFDLLRRLHSAWMDMWLISTAARDLLDEKTARRKAWDETPDGEFVPPLRRSIGTTRSLRLGWSPCTRGTSLATGACRASGSRRVSAGPCTSG